MSRNDDEVNQGRSLTVISAICGGLCLAAGLSYLTVTPTELTVSALVTLGALGCCALVGAGLWQARVHIESRRIPLVVLGVMGVGYMAGSALGFAGAQVARGHRLEPTGLPSALHVAGLVMGILLCVLVVAELARGESATAAYEPGARSHPIA